MSKFRELNEAERKALMACIANVDDLDLREDLLRQASFALVRSKDESLFGYYLNLFCPEEQKSERIHLSLNESPPECLAISSKNNDALFFLLYVKDYFIDFMEASSVGEWPTSEKDIIFVPKDLVKLKYSTQ